MVIFSDVCWEIKIVIPFGDLSREYQELCEKVDTVVECVFKKGWFVLGEHVEQFEKSFAAYIGEEVYSIGVGSGTEALHLALVAAGVGHGDYVITVPNTAMPTVSAISFAGARPLFVDIDLQNYTMDPVQLRDVVSREKKRLGENLKAVIPVHLYGQSADIDPICMIAKEFGLTIIEDACQAHGAEYKGRKVGSFGDFAAFSFYPSKNLGAYGDGGIIVTKDLSNAQKLKMLRNYGQDKRHYHKIKGFNSRLDELQAAILLLKLDYLDEWNDRRRKIASIYTKGIDNPAIITPSEANYGKHVFHLYVVRHPDRESMQSYLRDNGVSTLVHYPIPIHLQQAYKELEYSEGCFPITEKAAKEIISLPIFPQLRDGEIEKIVKLINKYN